MEPTTSTQLRGWIFDVYPDLHNGVSVWITDENGVTHHFHDDVTPYFFVAGTQEQLRAVCKELNQAPYPVELKRTLRYEPFQRREIVVLQVRVLRVNDYAILVRKVHEEFRAVRLYHGNLTIPQIYFLENKVFPFAKCEVTVEDGKIIELRSDDSVGALHYSLPPLRVMTLAMQSEPENPKDPAHGYRGPIVVGYENQEYILPETSAKDMLQSLRRHIIVYDPDVLVTDHGDAFLFGYLLKLARENGVELPLSRDRKMHVRSRRAQSRHSYGKIMYLPASHWLFGRLHVDRQSAILFDDYAWHGAVQAARLSRRALQHSCRSTIGGLVSALENAIAYERGVLIPYQKEQSEEEQSVDELVRIDRGGLVYQPVAGLHFDVDLLDFKAMFTAIMALLNISGETINCNCCTGNYVPELKLRVCKKHHGIVSLAAEIIVALRFGFKRLKNATLSDELRAIYEARDAAAKWLGVAIFGFAAHTSALFGLMSAHAAVCAFAREFILRAIQKAKGRGFQVLHVITDCLFIQKPNTTDEELAELVKEIEAATGLPIALEDRYKWIAFLTSRTDSERSVPNKYFAASKQTGKIKVRGIAARRHDTPAWIAQVQTAIVQKLAEASTLEEMAALLPEVMDIITAALDRLRSGHVPLWMLTIACSISKLPSEYKVNNLNAAVARQLEAQGVELHPGERIRYVVIDHEADIDSDRVLPWDIMTEGQDGYDVQYYEKLFLRAVEEVFEPLGISSEMLHERLNNFLPLPVLQKKITEPEMKFWGPLFANLN